MLELMFVEKTDGMVVHNVAKIDFGGASDKMKLRLLIVDGFGNRVGDVYLLIEEIVVISTYDYNDI